MKTNLEKFTTSQNKEQLIKTLIAIKNVAGLNSINERIVRCSFNNEFFHAYSIIQKDSIFYALKDIVLPCNEIIEQLPDKELIYIISEPNDFDKLFSQLEYNLTDLVKLRLNHINGDVISMDAKNDKLKINLSAGEPKMIKILTLDDINKKFTDNIIGKFRINADTQDQLLKLIKTNNKKEILTATIKNNILTISDDNWELNIGVNELNLPDDLTWVFSKNYLTQFKKTDLIISFTETYICITDEKFRLMFATEHEI